MRGRNFPVSGGFSHHGAGFAASWQACLQKMKWLGWQRTFEEAERDCQRRRMPGRKADPDGQSRVSVAWGGPTVKVQSSRPKKSEGPELGMRSERPGKS